MIRHPIFFRGNMYYIACGSNLNKEEMKQRCKDAKFVSLARLENYTLTYRGNPGRAYLTVDKKKEILYELPYGM